MNTPLATYTISHQQFTAHSQPAGLYVVATPIGNLGDISLRGLEIIAGCDLLACEDTRVTAKLLNRYGIRQKMHAYHEHNANDVGPRLLEAVREGKSVALVSDAGTPLVSDPGSRLVELARDEGIAVTPVPGASAPLAALVASGLPSDVFLFAGFLPTKSGQRQAALERWKNTPATLIFFESPNRIGKALNDAKEIFGENRIAAVCRELTKLHEEVVRAPLGELAARYQEETVKGEIVLVIAPSVEDQTTLEPETVLTDLLQSMSVNQAAAQAAKLIGRPKRELYALALELKKSDGE